MFWTVVLTAMGTALLFAVGRNFVTAEKTLLRKIDHKHAIASEQFRREMGVMMGPMIVGGNRVADLHNGEQIFPAMLRAIAEAERTITFETYIYWSGTIGQRFTAALSERSRAGIPVKVLVDWVGAKKMESAMLDGMRDAGVEVHRYHPLTWYNIGRLNNRTHRKLLVIDGRVGFTGGVGVADHWDGSAQDPEHWRDMHFRVEGPVVAQLQAGFLDNWIKTTGEVLHGAEYFPALERVGDTDAHLFISSPTGGGESMHLMYLMAIAAAESTIDLEASYFVPDTLIINALVAARKRGVAVRILLPGEHIDSDVVRLSSRRLWGDLLLAGVEIFEYTPTMMHSKLLIVDQEMVSVGSTNFDIRSFQLNDEASLNLYDQAFAAQLTVVFNRDVQQGRRYTHAMWKARPLAERFAETVLLPIRSQL